MFGSTVLEVAIGMALIYLLLSLLVSGISEFFSSFFQIRASNLESAIKQMLGDEHAEKLFKNGRIKRLSSPAFWIFSANKPSYISSRAFTETLLQELEAGDGVSTAKASLQLQKLADSVSNQTNVEQAKSEVNSFLLNVGAEDDASAAQLKNEIESIKNDDKIQTNTQIEARLRGMVRNLDLARVITSAEQLADGDALKEQILTLANGSSARMVDIREEIEGWFNDMMDQASGWYRKRMTIFNIGFAAAVVLVLNVDSVEVANRLANDPTVRKAMVVTAESYATMADKAEPSAGGTKPDPKLEKAAAYEKVVAIRQEINKLRLPIGWSHEEARKLVPFFYKESLGTASSKKSDDVQKEVDRVKKGPSIGAANPSLGPSLEPLELPFWAGVRQSATEWITKASGWFVTILAISLGAPFWFDLLDNLMRVYRKIPTDSEKK